MFGFLLRAAFHDVASLLASSTIRLDTVHNEASLVKSCQIVLSTCSNESTNQSTTLRFGTELKLHNVFLIWFPLKVDNCFVAKCLGFLYILVSEYSTHNIAALQAYHSNKMDPEV